MNLLERRRAMMNATGELYCPYIKDGLIFWLDGLNLWSDGTQWIDRIGKRVITLNNCSVSDLGIVFASGSYGEYAGQIGEDWKNETIEAACSGTREQNCILFPPSIDGLTTPIGLIQGNSTNGAGFYCDGSLFRKPVVNVGWKTVSVNRNYAVRNKSSVGFSSQTDSWGKNTSGYTYIGRRVNTNSYQFLGTIYAIRIYNRQLSIAEMQQNQEVDNQRFNLGL